MFYNGYFLLELNMGINRMQFKDRINTIIRENEIVKIIVSNPIDKNQKYKKIVLENKINHYMVNSYTDRQSFTANIDESAVLDTICDYINNFKQINIFSTEFEYMIKISKADKVFLTKTKSNNYNKPTLNNNREKNYILKENEIIEPLIDMGIFTKDGKIVKSMYDKYRQINRFIELIDDYIKNNNIKSINIVDFGCGKSYLTFVVYYYFRYIKNIDITMVGLDLKEDVIRKCNDTAKKYGYSSLRFEIGDINGYKPQMDVDMIITLHACDIATDYALFNAINWNVKMIFSVPCCQHEVNKQISSNKLPIITRYGLIKERISSDFTDIIRCNLLKAMSYNVEMIEFVAFDDTPKNILIRANLTKIPLNIRKQYLKEVLDLQNMFSFKQKLYLLLKEKLSESKLMSES